MGWKPGLGICIIIIILFILPCQASMSSDIFYKFLNNSKTVTNANDIVYVKSAYTLNNTVQSHQHIRGIVDIVGFNQMICIDGVQYISGPPEEHAIIKTKLWQEGITSTYVDYIMITDERITTVGNITMTEIDIHLLWHYFVTKTKRICGVNGCRTITYQVKVYCLEVATFTASRPTPQPYPEFIDPKLNVIVYNDSIKPKTIIHLPDTAYILGYTIEFQNESIEYFHSTVSIENQDNGVPFGNITSVPSQCIYEDSDIFSRAGQNIIINSTEMDDSLRIYAMTPFDQLEINYTVTNYSERHMLDHVQLSSAFSLLMLAWVIVFLFKYYRK